MRGKMYKCFLLIIITYSLFAYLNNTYASDVHKLDKETTSLIGDLIRQTNEINTQMALLREKTKNLELMKKAFTNKFLWSKGIDFYKKENWSLNVDSDTGAMSMINIQGRQEAETATEYTSEDH